MRASFKLVLFQVLETPMSERRSPVYGHDLDESMRAENDTTPRGLDIIALIRYANRRGK